MEKEELDMEFKHLCCFLRLKEKHQPHEPVSNELFDVFAPKITQRSSDLQLFIGKNVFLEKKANFWGE